MEDNLHELGWKYGWDPMWVGFHAIYGGDGKYSSSCFRLSFDIGLLRLCLDFASSCCLAGLQCCLAQGCSRSRIPTSSSGKERLFGLNFLIKSFWPSYLLQLQRSFCLELGCVAGCSKGGSHGVISGLVFQWRGSLSIGGLARRAPGHIFRYLASCQPSTIPHSAVTILNCIFFCGSC